MSSVQLYVYDLSNGLARQLSLQMTGKQIDGIWHTSVVVFGHEVYYGQGIDVTAPGKSHHGRPTQIIDMGDTALDEEIFQEYLEDVRDHYTAEKYHLLDFNCNSFTNDCIGFLTGGSIPSWIKDLPQDFLSTPFGAALRPTIDSMFRRPSAQAAPPPTDVPNPELSSTLLQALASRAASGSAVSPAFPTPVPTLPRSTPSTLTSSLQITTNPASLTSLLSSYRCVCVFFTSPACAPCRAVESAFENLALSKASVGVAFAKVDMAVGLGGQVASQWSVRVTPTFLFFLDGKKIHELKGADAPELRTQVDILIFQAFPPHPHAAMSFPVVRAISLQPILFSQVPAWDAALGKLVSFIDSAGQTSEFNPSDVKTVMSTKVVPFLQARFPGPGQLSPPSIASASAQFLTQWASLTVALSKVLPPPEMFPLVDFWRLGLLDNSVSAWAAAEAAAGNTEVTQILLNNAIGVLDTTVPTPRNLILTTIRLLANYFSNASLARHLLDPSPGVPISSKSPSPRQNLTALLIPALLHGDALVRTAAASLAFNLAAHYQRPLIEAQKNGKRGETAADNASEGQGDWEMEIVSAVLEALEREKQSEDVVHRLTASLALLLHLSPYWKQLFSLVEVLQVKETLRAKLNGGGCGGKGAQKKEVRKLIDEVMTMCS